MSLSRWLTRAWHQPVIRGIASAVAAYYTGGAAGLSTAGSAAAAGAAGGAAYNKARGASPIKGAIIGGSLGYGAGSYAAGSAGTGTAAGSTATGAAAAPTISGPAVGGGTNLGAGTVYGGTGEGAVVSGAGAGAAPPSVSSALGGFGSKYAVPLTALGASLIMGRQKTPELNNLQDIAGPAKDVGTQYLNAVKSGQLPAGYQNQYDSYLRDQTAAVKQQYAGMGMSGSTQEAEALQRVQGNAQIVRDQLMGSVLNQGLNSLGFATGPYTNIANVQLAQDQQAQQALSTFAMTYGLMQAGMGK